MMEVLADSALVFAFLGFASFVVLYFLRSKWRATSVGRNAMALMASCGLLLGLSLSRLILGDPWFDRHKELLRLISYGLIGCIAWWRVALLVKLQQEARRERQRVEPGSR